MVPPKKPPKSCVREPRIVGVPYKGKPDRGRGPTLLKEVVKARNNGKILEVEWNNRGQPIGTNSKTMMSYWGFIVKKNIPITYKSWPHVPQELKDAQFEDLMLTFTVDHSRKGYLMEAGSYSWKNFKSELTRNWLYDPEANLRETPPKKYSFIDNSDWKTFVNSRLNREFQELSEANRKRATNSNPYPQRHSRLGYARLEEEVIERLKKENIIISELDRTTLWKFIRCDSEGNVVDASVQKVIDIIDNLKACSSEGESDNSGRNDFLHRALNKGEHGGRVRAVGGGVRISTYFGKGDTKKERSDKLKNMESRVNIMKLDIRDLKRSKKGNEKVSGIDENEQSFSDNNGVEFDPIQERGFEDLEVMDHENQSLGMSKKKSQKISRVDENVESSSHNDRTEVESTILVRGSEIPKVLEHVIRDLKRSKKDNKKSSGIGENEEPLSDNSEAEFDPIQETGFEDSEFMDHEDRDLGMSKKRSQEISRTDKNVESSSHNDGAEVESTILKRGSEIPEVNSSKSKDTFVELEPLEQGVASSNFSLQNASNDLEVEVPNPNLLPLILRLFYKCIFYMPKDFQIKLPVNITLLEKDTFCSIGKVQCLQFLSQAWIGADHILIYMSLKNETLKHKNLRHRFGFLCPSRISLPPMKFNDSKMAQENQRSRSEYILNIFKRETIKGKVFLAPYNSGNHWILCVIDPYDDVVYYLDSFKQSPSVREDLVEVVETLLTTQMTMIVGILS